MVLIIGGDLTELLLSNGLDLPSPAVVSISMVTLPVVVFSIQLILQAKPTALLKIERDEISVDSQNYYQEKIYFSYIFSHVKNNTT